MAIIQISRIQVRRGLQENLPQLASGEIGWSIDERRLFIGNGTHAEGAPILGNTELLTEFSDIFNLSGVYTFTGAAAGYVVQTGPSLVAPVTRSLQDKLDDFANFRDFGGVGDGSTNDVAAFNRAIEELYKASVVTTGIHSAEQKLRTLYIPAGKYMLSGDFIRMLPYVKLKGDGKNATIIIQSDITQPCTLKSADSTGKIATESGFAVGTSIYPIGLLVEDLTLTHLGDKDVVQVDSVTDVMFSSVRMQGNKGLPTSFDINWPSVAGASAQACLNFSSVRPTTATISNKIALINCEFIGNIYGIYSDSKVNSVTVFNGLFSQLVQGVRLGQENGGNPQPNSFKVTYSLFDSIAREGMSSQTSYGGVSNVVSAFNTYRDVGATNTNSTTPATSIINFSGDNSYSIGDVFDRLATAIIPAVVLNGKASFATLPNGALQLGKQTTVGGRSVDLIAASTSIAGVVGVGESATTVEYKITRDTGSRVGTMRITPFLTTVSYDDEYVENGNIGVTIVPVLNSGTIELQYTATAGSNAVLTTTSRTLL